MRFASVTHAGTDLAVAIDSERAVPIGGWSELGAETSLSRLRDCDLSRSERLPLSEVRFRPLIPNPGKIICVGLNYVAHAREAGRDVPEYPALFTKFASTLTGAYDAIECPPESSAVDYEGELVVVIGEHCRRVPRDQALDVVAGLTVANDVSMRDYQNKTHQWLQGKAWDRTTPIGPELVTLDEVGPLDQLVVRTRVNGQVVQEASTSLMVFDIPTLVAVVSEFAALAPGDLILTGTPSGIGFRRDPPLLLTAGDVVEVEVPGVGCVRNSFV